MDKRRPINSKKKVLRDKGSILKQNYSQKSINNTTKVKKKCKFFTKNQLFPGPYQQKDFVGLDCEMVEVDDGENALARVSIVDYTGKVLFDEYVRPTKNITDFRYKYSGITMSKLNSQGLPFKLVQAKAREILKDKIIVGHALNNDLKVLNHECPRSLIRDTAFFKPLRKKLITKGEKQEEVSLEKESISSSGPPSLKSLVQRWLKDFAFQHGVHNSVEDARMCMKLYRKFQIPWESMFAEAPVLAKTESVGNDVLSMKNSINESKQKRFCGKKPYVLKKNTKFQDRFGIFKERKTKLSLVGKIETYDQKDIINELLQVKKIAQSLTEKYNRKEN